MPVGFANKQQVKFIIGGYARWASLSPMNFNLHISSSLIHLDSAGAAGDGSSVVWLILDRGEALPLAPGRNYLLDQPDIFDTNSCCVRQGFDDKVFQVGKIGIIKASAWHRNLD